MSRPEAARMTRRDLWICGVFVAAYLALCLSQIDHGIASLDAHGIIGVVQTLIGNHKIDISRPPGHPTTEFYLFGAIAWFLHVVGHSFSERVYSLGQALAAVATLILFYDLLRRLNVPRWRAAVAVFSLALSAQFFANAIDGEEFVFALFFVLLAARLLVSGRFYMSILAFALATGCRPEIIFAFVIYPVYFFYTRADARRIVFSVTALALSIGVVWLPVLVTGVHAPYAAGMNFKQALLVGGYKLIFQCFGALTFILLLAVLVRACRRWRRPDFPSNFFGALACVMPILFFALFFRYATKPAYVLVALPFLLISATESRALLLAIAAFTAIDFFYKIDIFQDRQLTAPFVTRGSGIAAIRQKPFYRLDYLRSISAQCGDARTLVIADAAPWDFEYHIARGTFPAQEKRDPMQPIPAFFRERSESCVIMPRDAAFARELLAAWHANGYKVKMDAWLYRTAFARYDINRPNESSGFELFSVKQ